MAAGTSYYAASPVMRTRSATPVSMNDMSRLLSASNDKKGLGHAKTYFNPASQKLYSRYSTKEWEESNKNYFSLSESERNVAERLRSDMWRAVKTTDARTKNRQHANTKKLGNRVSDIAYWKSELVNEMREMDTETENLEEHKRVLEKAYADTKTPFIIAEECLLQREKRQGIDQVHDDVERALSREVDCIRRCQNKMKTLIQKAEVQLKMNRAAQHNCDKDAKDKGHAQNVDDKMYGLRNSSGGIGFHPGIENIDNTVTIPYTWVKYTQENIRRSQHEREMSEKLRGEIDSLLRACANEMWSHFNNVNNAFQSRVQSTQDAKAKLQSHMQRTCNEIRDMERAIELLKKAIKDKEGPMKVAQTRLDERTRRINVELCNDPVMKGLQKEVHEIRESVRILKDKLRRAENALIRLLKTRAQLEHDIGVKENSLQIDSKVCMGMRKNMPMDPKTGPVYTMPVSCY